MRKPFFFLGVLTLLLAITQVAAAGTTVPLKWVDSGKVVYPGVHFTVQIHAEASRTLGGLADAAISINNLAFGFTEGGWWLDPHVILVMGGHQYDMGSMPWLKGSYDVTFEFTIYCNGTMIVKAVNYGYTHEYVVPNTSLPVYYFTESNPALHSSVSIGRVDKFMTCGDFHGDLPQPGSGSSGGAPSNPQPDLKQLLMYVGVGLLALIGVLIITSIYNALRPR